MACAGGTLDTSEEGAEGAGEILQSALGSADLPPAAAGQPGIAASAGPGASACGSSGAGADRRTSWSGCAGAFAPANGARPASKPSVVAALAGLDGCASACGAEGTSTVARANGRPD